jgi:hypothetical protein
MNKTITVQTDPKKSWMENKNGCPSVGTMHIWFDANGTKAYVEFANSSGQSLRGGFSINIEAMDKAVKQYAEQRKLFQDDNDQNSHL